MEKVGLALCLCLSIGLVPLVFYGSENYTRDTLFEARLEGLDIVEKRMKEFEQYKPQLRKVSNRVTMAIGYAMAASVIIEGPDGLIIVDTTENVTTGNQILHDIRANLTDKPIKAIVYTHFHADHCTGTQGFLEDSDDDVLIIAHEDYIIETNTQSHVMPTLLRRSIKQFAATLPDKIRKNPSFGNVFKWYGEVVVGLRPNYFITEDVHEMNIAGLNLVFYHLPGETRDHLLVWLPDERTLIPGDNIYSSFPNIYAIRGSINRDSTLWAKALDKMKSLRPLNLAPPHYMPITGEEEIQELLTVYRDAILFVHDQTIRYMNKGLHPDEIVQKVKLPPHIASNYFLEPLYGTPEWTVKSIFSYYLGWFSGDPVELTPLTPKERAQRMVDWMGKQQIIDQAWTALSEDDPQWALELASHVHKLNPDYREAIRIRKAAMTELAKRQTSVNGHHFYLSSIYDDYNLVDWEKLTSSVSKAIHQLPMSNILSALKYRVKAEEDAIVKMNISAAFVFTDTEETFCLSLRNAVLNIDQGCEPTEHYYVVLQTKTTVLKDVVAKKRSALAAYVNGEMSIQGGLWRLKSFMDCFE